MKPLSTESKTRRALTAVGLVASMALPRAYAQSEPMRILTGAANGAYFNCSEGNCSIRMPTVIDQQIVDQLGKVSDLTRQRYTKLIGNTRQDLNHLLRLVTHGDRSLYGLSYGSAMSNRTIPADDLYAVYTKFVEARELVRNDFEMNAQFFEGKLDGIPTKDNEYIAKELPTVIGGQIDRLRASFEARVKTISSLVCNLKYSVILPQTGEPVLNKKVFICDDAGNVAISIDAEGVKLNAADRATIIEQMNRLRRPTDPVIHSISELGRDTRGVIKALAETWGEAQSYRWSDITDGPMSWILPDRVAKGNEERLVARKKTFDDFVEYMWFRSALRKTFGLPIGTFAINKFPLRTLQRDLFTTTTKMLLNLPDENMFEQLPQIDMVQTTDGNGDTRRAKDNFDAVRVKLTDLYTEALNIIESKASDPFGGRASQIVKDGDFGVIDKANGLYEEVKGNSQTWKVLYFAIKLMAADFYEESALRSLGGMQKMTAIYRKRYIDIPDQERARYLPFIKTFNEIINTDGAIATPDGDVSFNMDVQNANEETVSTDIRTLYRRLVVELQEWTTNISQARVLNVQLDVARRASGVNKSTEFEMAHRRALEL
jgi:hypothetical protein